MSKEAKLVSIIIAIVIVVAGVGFFLMKSTPQEVTDNGPSTTAPVDKQEALNRSTPNVRGKTDSTITVIEFADMQCPGCAAANPQVDNLVKQYGDKVKFVFRHFPLPMHKNAMVAADAVEAAGEQGKFWEMVDELYARQPEWDELSDPKPVFRQIAQNMGLDAEKFDKSLVTHPHRDRINQDKADGAALGNPGTPTFYINGEQIFQGGIPELKQKIEEALKQKPQ